jgi:hypothetical protein
VKKPRVSIFFIRPKRKSQNFNIVRNQLFHRVTLFDIERAPMQEYSSKANITMHSSSALNQFMSSLLVSSGARNRSIEIVDDKATARPGSPLSRPPRKHRLLHRRASTGDYDLKWDEDVQNSASLTKCIPRKDRDDTNDLAKADKADIEECKKRLQIWPRRNSTGGFEPGTSKWEKMEIIKDLSSAPLILPRRRRAREAKDVDNSQSAREESEATVSKRAKDESLKRHGKSDEATGKHLGTRIAM